LAQWRLERILEGTSRKSCLAQSVKTIHLFDSILTPALKAKSQEAEAYHSYLQYPENASLMRKRKTAIEPLFDLVSKAIGTESNHKQLPVKLKFDSF
jgi:hypothetical protein